MLFADAIDPHTLGGSALGVSIIMAVGMWIDKLIVARREQRKMDIEAAERLEKLKSDAQLALRTADIAAATALLEAKVTANAKKTDDCENAHQKTADQLGEVKSKLAACTAAHNATELRIASLEQSVVTVAAAIPPPNPKGQ